MIRVIIVEDDPLVARLNAACLEQLPQVRVTGTFTNGQQALEFLKEHPVELAVVDVYMPVCSGMELLRRLRGLGIPTAVIMITAATEMKIVEEALRLGIEDYIIKPFSYDRLKDAVLKFHSKTQLVNANTTVDQAVVDRLLGNDSPVVRRQELPKGLNARTLESIRALLDADPQGEHTCESLSSRSGLSKVTVRHYLNHLIETGVLTSAIDYETGGRPRVRYRLARPVAGAKLVPDRPAVE